MSKSTVFISGALAFCFGLFVGLLVMSSEIENFKKDKTQADIARKKAEAEQKRMWETQLEFKTELNKANFRKDELIREVAALKENLSVATKTNVVKNDPLQKDSAIASEEKQWREVARWTGKGIKTTETFHISSNTWRISWVTRPGENAEYGLGLLQIYVYRPDGSLVDIAANVGVVKGEDINSSVMRGSGDYYLTINAVQPYVIVVETK
jgi:hypothetical protein